MKLFYAPGACSLGIHVLLEEIGQPYELHKLNLKDNEQHKPDYVELNPKAKVPALLRDDDTVLTEFGAIATYLARQNPALNLVPAGADAEARVREALDYVVGTVHGQGFARMFRPENFAPNAVDHDAVKAKGREMIVKAFERLNRTLAGHAYLGGDHLSIGDAALFYVEFWAAVRAHIELPPNLAGHFARMKQRPAVQKVLAAEGLPS